MKKLFIIAGAVIAFAACKKDGDNDTQTPTDHLTAAKWFLAAETEREQGNGIDTTYDYMSEYEACELDNYMLFTKDSVVYDNGATKCNPTDAQVIARATWSLIENNNKLVIMYVGGSDTMNVTVLNATTLELKEVDTDEDGYTYTYIQRWKH